MTQPRVLREQFRRQETSGEQSRCGRTSQCELVARLKVTIGLAEALSGTRASGFTGLDDAAHHVSQQAEFPSHPLNRVAKECRCLTRNISPAIHIL